MRVTETAHWLEWQDWANPILQQPYEVKDGKIHIPNVPGAGWNGTKRRSARTWLTISRHANASPPEFNTLLSLGANELGKLLPAKNEIIAYSGAGFDSAPLFFMCCQPDLAGNAQERNIRIPASINVPARSGRRIRSGTHAAKWLPR
jgi:hypothetical protein